MKQIYLDHAATTPTDKTVIATMLPYFGEMFGNPSSMYTSGRYAKEVLEKSRKDVADHLHAIPEEIIFTSGGTESNNMAILGLARAHKKYGNHILVSSIEHKSVLASAKVLQKEGFKVEYIPVDEEGMVDMVWLLKHLNPETILVSVMYANNEIGTIEPIRAITSVIKHHKRGMFPLVHTDACQAAGYFALDTKSLGVDALTFNGSKLYGPKGIGVLYKRKGVAIEPLIVGGGQESGLRSGTENLPAVVGLAHALAQSKKDREEEFKRVLGLREYTLRKLYEAIPDMKLNGHPLRRLPNNIHISIPYVEGESMVLMLDEMGIAVSTGSACSSNDLQVSHVLVAIGQDETLMHGSLRITLGKSTTKRDCNYFVESLVKCVAKLRLLSPLTVQTI